MVARSAAWKVDASSFSTVESLLTPFHQLFKRPHWDKNFSWQLWLSIRLLTDEAKCSWQIFLINNFLSSTWNLLCVTKVVNQKLWKKLLSTKKGLTCFLFSEGKIHQWDLVIYHFLIDNTKYEFVAMFQNSHWSQKVADRKESSTRNSCQQHLVLRVYVVNSPRDQGFPKFQTSSNSPAFHIQ